MDFTAKGQRNSLMFAVLTLVVIGVSLIFSTWQILRQQEEASLQYLAMSARSISQTVENTFRQYWRLEGHKGEFWPRMSDFFSGLEGESEVLFIQVLDSRGRRIFEARRDGNPVTGQPEMNVEKLSGLEQGGETYEVRLPGPNSIFVYATRIRQIESSSPRRLFSLGDPASYMLVGLSMVNNQRLFNSFRNNALLQSLYILAAAIFIWALSVSLISRRALLGKAKVLERFQDKLLDNMPDGLITLGPDNEIQSANPAAHAMLNCSEGSMVGKSLRELAPALADSIQQARPHREAAGWRQAEVDGKQMEIRLSAFSGEEDRPVRLLLFRDRTRLHSLERSLAEAEKMAAVGTLAAGVAHEIRNPLSALRGFAQYFAKKFSGTKPDEEYANTMVREADRLNRVITDLLYLSRDKSTESRPVDLDEVVSEVATLLRFDLTAHRVGLDLDLQIPFILADADSVKQALLNLMLNSLDALGERAVAEPEFAGEARIAIRSYAEEDWAVLEVEDNGLGMAEEQKKQAFEAFFTSKAKGTGLGLSLVNKTVREHGGKTAIDSAPGQGCRIRLYFHPSGGPLDD